ncbi:MAG: HypC/HybG/HupF family hydrogenase formation chaperone [Actinomycetia bacterium]|nr:HypC/HybG/HupF family hydrogenase formation chaperone [Actinomycetes bacterium]
MCLGVPGRIVDVSDTELLRSGTVDFGGVTKTACLEYLPDAAVGDWVLVHVGFAITRLDEPAARETLSLLAGAGLLDEALGAEPAGRPA